MSVISVAPVGYMSVISVAPVGYMSVSLCHQSNKKTKMPARHLTNPAKPEVRAPLLGKRHQDVTISRLLLALVCLWWLACQATIVVVVVLDNLFIWYGVVFLFNIMLLLAHPHPQHTDIHICTHAIHHLLFSACFMNIPDDGFLLQTTLLGTVEI